MRDVSVPLAGAVSIRTGFPSIPFQNPLHFAFLFSSKKAESDLSPSNFHPAVDRARAPIVTNWGVCPGPISHNNEQTQTVEGII